MRTWLFIFCAALLTSASAVSAQVIYQPVQYQFGSRVKFYYGGSDRAVVANALTYDQYRNAYDVSARYPDAFGEPVTPPLRIYNDLFPGRNVALLGYTPMDAMNEAYAGVPNYFRKSDLLQSAERQSDGSWLISSKAEPGHFGPVSPLAGIIEIKPASRAVHGPVFIIPKQLLQPPSDKWVASAR